jgi:signal peptidase II
VRIARTGARHNKKVTIAPELPPARILARPRARVGVRLGAACVGAAILAVDQVAKAEALAKYPHSGDSAPGAGSPGAVSVRLVRNTGASGGLASGYPVLIALFAMAAVIVLAVVVHRAHRPVLAFGWAIVAGGAAGNLSDRLFRSPGWGRGAVVDWIRIGHSNSSFNLADTAIHLGIVLVLLGSVWRGRSARRRARV